MSAELVCLVLFYSFEHWRDPFSFELHQRLVASEAWRMCEIGKPNRKEPSRRVDSDAAD